MKILITGSNGLLGQKLVHALRVREDVELLATSQDVNRISTSDGYLYRTLDITNMEDVDEMISGFEPDAVINTAAMTQVDLCEELREKCRQVNVGAVAYLIAACKKVNAHFIQLSTDFVFNGEEGPYGEEDVPDPLSYYAQSKYDAEQLIINSGLSHWSIVRTIIIYGVAEQMSRSNIVLWAMDALQKREPLKIVNDQYRAPTLAEDLAEGCISIAAKKASGIYHISGPETFSIFELVQRIGNYFGWAHNHVQAVSTDSLAQKAKRPPRTGFILDKAMKEIEYAPKTFEEGLEIVAEQLQSLASP